MEDHCYEMEIAIGSSKRERGTDSDPPTPSKPQKGKKAKKPTECEENEVPNSAILDAIKALGTKVDLQHEELSTQMKQHSAMIASVAKSVQINAQELRECKDKIKMMEKQIENLSEVNNDLKIRVLEEERYKRRWCLRIKGLKENSNERIREDVIQLLGKITPEFASTMEEAVDVVHRVGRKETGRSREVIILFTRRLVRDEVWKRTKSSAVCKEAGIRFAEDLTKEDRLLRSELWPRIAQARKEGKAAGFRGPFGYIEGKRIT